MRKLHISAILLFSLFILSGTAHAQSFFGWNKGDVEVEKNSVVFGERSDNPSTPVANKQKLFLKDDGKLYLLDENGDASAVGDSVLDSDATTVFLNDENSSKDVSITNNLEVGGTLSVGGTDERWEAETGGYIDFNDAGDDTVTLGTSAGAQIIAHGAGASIAGNLSVDGVTFVVDKDNNRVGVGTATPSVPLNIATSGTVPFKISSSSGTAALVDIATSTANIDSGIRFNSTTMQDWTMGVANSITRGTRGAFVIGADLNTPSGSAQKVLILGQDGSVDINNNLSTSGVTNATAPAGASTYIEVYINGVLHEIEAKLPSA